jgi:hypothetical protein
MKGLLITMPQVLLQLEKEIQNFFKTLGGSRK